MASDRQPNQAPPDPDPTLTPGLAPGGGTEPGDTPPDSGQESATSNPDPSETNMPSIEKNCSGTTEKPVIRSKLSRIRL